MINVSFAILACITNLIKNTNNNSYDFYNYYENSSVVNVVFAFINYET